MSQKYANSVIIDIHRPRTCCKESLNDIKKKDAKKRTNEKAIRKPSESSLRKYSLPGNKPLLVATFKKDHLILPYRLYTKKQEKIKNKIRLAIELTEKYKIIATDLRKRLHVDDPSDNVRAVTDVDESFYRYFDSHPLAQYIPLYKSLQFIFHKQLRMKQEVGYRRDCILNIHVKHRNELRIFEQSVQKYKEQSKLFEVFISEDYQKSMACLKKCDDFMLKVNEKIYELENLANIQFTIQSRLIGLDYMYFVQQKYGRFLYYMSPPSWRAKHREFARSVEIEAKGFDLGTSSEEDTFNVIFEKMKKECVSGLVRPVLYFSHPDNLMIIFESIAKHQLHNFSRECCLTPYTANLNNGIKKLKNEIELETATVTRGIRQIEELIDFCDTRKSQLQDKFIRILHGLFYDSVAAIDVLKLQLHLEFCYEKLNGEQSWKLSSLSYAKALERMYMDYSYKLDAIHSNKIKVLRKQYLEREKHKMKRAKDAARELRQFERLEHALLRAHEPVHANEPSPAVRRPSAPKTRRARFSKPAARTSSQRELTDAETEYLTLFTEWTEHEDPANYIQSLTISDDANNGQ